MNQISYKALLIILLGLDEDASDEVIADAVTAARAAQAGDLTTHSAARLSPEEEHVAHLMGNSADTLKRYGTKLR